MPPETPPQIVDVRGGLAHAGPLRRHALPLCRRACRAACLKQPVPHRNAPWPQAKVYGWRTLGGASRRLL